MLRGRTDLAQRRVSKRFCFYWRRRHPETSSPERPPPLDWSLRHKRSRTSFFKEGTDCHVSYSKPLRTSPILLYVLGYFPEILPRGYRLGISRRLIVRLLASIVLDNLPSYSTMHHAVLDLGLIVLDDARLATIFTGDGQ